MPTPPHRPVRLSAARVRRRFLRELWSGLVIVWPVLSGLLLCMAALGVSIGLVEGWRVGDALYFAFVSGLTIGYGDLLPTLPLTKLLAVAIGATGILLTALLGAVGVQALARSQTPEDAD